MDRRKQNSENPSGALSKSGVDPPRLYHRLNCMLFHFSDLNTGIEAYKTTQQYSGASLSNTSLNSGAANSHLVAGVEVELAKWLGIGLKGKMITFFRHVDELTRDKTKL